MMDVNAGRMLCDGFVPVNVTSRCKNIRDVPASFVFSATVPDVPIVPPLLFLSRRRLCPLSIGSRRCHAESSDYAAQRSWKNPLMVRHAHHERYSTMQVQALSRSSWARRRAAANFSQPLRI